MGTVNMLEAVRQSGRPAVVLAVTSDKCYREARRSERRVEDDPLGGSDPYAASKACSELVASAYRDSYFAAGSRSDCGVALATVRAGNVIGGGDWAGDRLVPDMVRALSAGAPARIRNSGATRPWQHVLDPLSGYLWLGAKMLSEGADGLAEAWNFGPDSGSAVTVGELADRVVRAWGAGSWEEAADSGAPHEAEFLGLNCDKAASRLRWRPTYDLDSAVEATVAWYRQASGRPDMLGFTVRQIADYVRSARSTGAEWAGPCDEAAAT
jgi:CDP-glucose 4,6-dehydratase